VNVSYEEAPRERSLVKGLVAGAIAGVVATAAKSIVERYYPPRVHGKPEPPVVLAEHTAGHSLDGPVKTAAKEGIHWGYGAAAGAIYGAVAEYYPEVTAKEGATFGMALMSLTHGSAFPAMGL
jgi:putative membrane protein